MNQEHRQGLPPSTPVVAMESLTIGVKYLSLYIILQLNTDGDDDETTLVQLEGREGDYIYTSWSTCPFDHAGVVRINNGTMSCTMTLKGRGRHGIPNVISVVFDQ
jgi:hypothetical protein